MDSLELLTLLKHQKEKGISCLYDKYAAALNGIIVRIIKSEHQAEEILQKTFLKITHTIDSYDEQHCTLFTWMSRIARQEAVDACQSPRPKEENIPSFAPSMTSSIALDDKAVLDHIYLLGYSPEETASRLNIPLDTVKTKLRSALAQLRQNIKYDPRQILSKAIIFSFFIAAVS